MNIKTTLLTTVALLGLTVQGTTQTVQAKDRNKSEQTEKATTLNESSRNRRELVRKGQESKSDTSKESSSTVESTESSTESKTKEVEDQQVDSKDITTDQFKEVSTGASYLGARKGVAYFKIYTSNTKSVIMPITSVDTIVFTDTVDSVEGITTYKLALNKEQLKAPEYKNASENMYFQINESIKIPTEDLGKVYTPKKTKSTDKQSTDKKSTDKKSTDKKSTDKKSTDKKSTDKKSTDKKSTDKKSTDTKDKSKTKNGKQHKTHKDTVEDKATKI